MMFKVGSAMTNESHFRKMGVEAVRNTMLIYQLQAKEVLGSPKCLRAIGKAASRSVLMASLISPFVRRSSYENPPLRVMEVRRSGQKPK
jgi:hypothetical protein